MRSKINTGMNDKSILKFGPHHRENDFVTVNKVNKNDKLMKAFSETL